MADEKDPIICLSSQDYRDLWTRKQRFMRRFAKLGHHVLYVESQYHVLTYLKNFRKNPRRCVAFLRKPQEVEPNLFIATPPLLLPFCQVFAPVAVINNLVVALWLKWVTVRLGFSNPLIYTYVVYSSLAVKLLGSKKILYEKVDDLAAARGLVRRATVEKLEARLLKISKLVIVTAGRLKEMLQDKHDNVHLITNACEVEHFRQAGKTKHIPAVVSSLPVPRLGFVGMLAYWIDLDLVAYIAKSHPEWQILFIGPVSVDISKLKALTNIHFIGRVPYRQLPSYMAGVDLFINPYKKDDVAASCSPLKVFEYLAAGKPVVTVPMPELRRFIPEVRFASGPAQFVECIEELLTLPAEERAGLSERLKSLVANDTWDNRFHRTQQLISETFKS